MIPSSSSSPYSTTLTTPKKSLIPPPKHWPASVAYLDHYVFKHKEHLPLPKKEKRVCVVRAPPSHWVIIQKIDKPDHPAFQQYGLFASKTIPPSTHICDYFGLVISEEESSATSSYLNQFSYIPLLLCDAEKMGNESRMINDFHGIAKNPNVKFENYIDENNEKRIGVFSMKQKIKKGEELLVSYGYGFKLD
eukprot:TRINITY_DN5615_c0_g2_i1.p1 TRINITY_DN5615_c0_g2~~TRINITY_DN5615_c0_g2_i1.p1  ORF type:complete len:192 (-),score=48.87 TRINITY_DN5615_c0_g2_i1:84-659(-)